MRLCTVLVLLLAVALSPARSSLAGEREEALIQSLSVEAIGLLSNGKLDKSRRQDGLRDLFTKYLDLPFIGRFVLGRYWRPLSPDQQGRYIKVFEDYVVNVYAKRLDGYSGETIKVNGSRSVGDQDTLVSSRLERAGGPPIAIDWRVRSDPSGGKVIDVVIEGVSMVISQREEFSSYLQRESIETLITRLDRESRT